MIKPVCNSTAVWTSDPHEKSTKFPGTLGKGVISVQEDDAQIQILGRFKLHPRCKKWVTVRLQHLSDGVKGDLKVLRSPLVNRGIVAELEF